MKPLFYKGFRWGQYLLPIPHALYRFIYEVDQRGQHLTKGSEMAKVKARFTYKVSAEGKALADKTIAIVQADRAKALKVGVRARYVDVAFITALAEAYVRAQSVQALQSEVAYCYENEKAITVPAVVRYQLLQGKASKNPAQVNDRAENAIQAKITSLASEKGCAWASKMKATRALAYGMKVKATDPEIADLVVFARV